MRWVLIQCKCLDKKKTCTHGQTEKSDAGAGHSSLTFKWLCLGGCRVEKWTFSLALKMILISKSQLCKYFPLTLYALLEHVDTGAFSPLP